MGLGKFPGEISQPISAFLKNTCKCYSNLNFYPPQLVKSQFLIFPLTPQKKTETRLTALLFYR